MSHFLLRLIVASLVFGLAPQPLVTAQQQDARLFQQTGYRVSDEKFWDYFKRRGAVRTFGYPVSNVFTLFGSKVQVFQRAIVQQQPDGTTGLMNILDDGLLPYTKINGSTLPGLDQEVIVRQPKVGTPDYHVKALQFIKDMCPDEWQGMKVNFYQTFINSVRAEDAFPDRPVDRGLLLGFNMEVWGLPTSKPTPDPENAGFVYQRFQRGIMHFDAATGATQGLLLADYVKAILTLQNLPGDLAAQAKQNALFGQFDTRSPLALARPSALSGTDLRGAFKKEPTVVVDPGHGGSEVGSSYQFVDGTRLVEKELNLKVAGKLAELLRSAGYVAVMTRTSDAQVNGKDDLTGDQKISLADDLQARVDRANGVRADLMISVHFNGLADTSRKGTQVFYADGRSFSDRAKALAELAQTNLVKSLREAGYETDNRGATADSGVLGRGSHYYILGPASDIVKRPSEMPGIIGEPLYITNAEDARALRQEKIQDAVARGYFETVKAYFARFPAS
ncbi:MAG: N-acetylmuramoyl-L-alanine amidase [Chloroflexota bacterium]